MIPATSTQSDSFATVTTPFGDNVLLLDGFAGREALSEPFSFQLRMRSADKALDGSRIVGQKVTVRLQRPGGFLRCFNGIVTRFAHTGADPSHAFYSAELAPRLWLLTLARDRRIFQNQSALDIIRSVLGEFEVAFDARVTASRYPVREYCVQYDESPLQFIARLMEEEGIFYYFTFADGAHTMVLGDSPSAHAALPHEAELWGGQPGEQAAGLPMLAAFRMEQGLGPASHVLADYDYVQAQTSQGSAQPASSAPGARQYIFPGRHKDASDAARKAAVRVAAQQVEARCGSGESNCHGLAAGGTFTLGGHVNAALNAEYVVRAVEHSVAGSHYANSFTVFPLAVPFRAPLVTPRPLVAGTHTATVVGSQGEEIWTDQHGRIKLKFHWDQAPGADQDSSCWVRVAQGMAGHGWGQLFLPRVGQEVVVSYVDGDPDRPLVTGSVYNGQVTPPVTLPSMQTQSVIRSRTSKNGSAGNELRMEDKAGAEELYLHAQRDMNVAVENKLSTTVVGAGESHVVQKGDRLVEVQSGNETHKVSGTRSLEVSGDETRTNGAAFTQEVSGTYTLKVSGDLVIDVTGAITIKSAGSVALEAGTSLSNKAGTTLANKAGTTLSGEGMTVQQKASASHTVESGGMLELKGAMVKLN
ncbi:hypothetical protein Tamer19_56460 [Cupriavidus sp. TA19]|uniref:type VI secretion system Vgr family protein n=1 Tax=Cupriavidus sp. TA19 TaxID=701108 RepID=UPI0027294875|nr:type VI secretion system tip protein VgrG [Cupriavidus sp. TA19]GLC96237.1 hypothetical protein Tamer19_56460 [Cupriavidus sp. TA19]